ncbi:bifunctional 3,4-dihydroxy-2-butanone-4-phosphate synthase/GTP cyclohydrolase II [Actinopolymorpha singaporensis]|uniref:Riboflavin biosynthesis protein RibBA n=1 Tax=Actinopolymorpha singaporensis TaxID=117157 RepID=A0A1H1VLC9_9ACTN|nr:bifunctional 3,4-dihydroxy-2-butanone-4-phosphate synthase/GTP cyclohydrolase II [Actinopolymorpha singaporensis]SDS85714.1 GTP cyclohydrolase II /3,4-dihydroxy-2-butanone 4-phosphate synthase [Actinopolymorpha singaporensis]
MSTPRDPVERALADLAAGRAVVVVDDEDRENEGDIIFAASAATPELVAFTVRHTSGVLCVPMEGADLDRLAVGPMTADNQDTMRTAFCVTVDAAAGITTGISAEDRTRTIRLLADPGTGPDDVVRPGHVFPLRYRPGGVLARRGHTEAAVDLVRLAGLPPVGVLAELVENDGTMMRGDALRRFAGEHDLALLTIEDLVRHRRRHERLVERVAETRIPTRHGDFRAVGYRCTVDGSEHVALVRGDLAIAERTADGGGPLVRLHSECLTGDAFGSLRCDCGPQLDRALAAVAADGAGVVVYLRGHEGRGIGLLAKLSAYALQDTGHDTVEANLALGLPVDARDYWIGAQILADLGVGRMRLLTNNPAKRAGLEAYGLTVTATTPLTIPPNGDNAHYLATKRDRLGHILPAEAGVVRQTTGRAS